MSDISFKIHNNFGTSQVSETTSDIKIDGIIFKKGISQIPITTPESGGYIYILNGSLMYKGANGTITLLGTS